MGCSLPRTPRCEQASGGGVVPGRKQRLGGEASCLQGVPAAAQSRRRLRGGPSRAPPQLPPAQKRGLGHRGERQACRQERAGPVCWPGCYVWDNYLPEPPGAVRTVSQLAPRSLAVCDPRSQVGCPQLVTAGDLYRFHCHLPLPRHQPVSHFVSPCPSLCLLVPLPRPLHVCVPVCV